MSKAFVPEDSAVEPEVTPPGRPNEPQPITPTGLRRLLDERATLDPNDEAVASRIAALDRILATVEVVEPALLDGGAGFGCEVVVSDESGARRTYAIVGPDEIDARGGRVSAGSPLGAALLGRRVGDVVEVERAGRVDELELVSVTVPSR